MTIARIPPLDAEPEARRALALDHLGVLADLFDRWMREPPPLASAAYVLGGNARTEWESDRFGKEDREPEHELVFGTALPFADLLAPHPREDERWDVGETSRFGQYAHRLWDGLLQVEELEHR